MNKDLEDSIERFNKYDKDPFVILFLDVIDRFFIDFAMIIIIINIRSSIRFYISKNEEQVKSNI